MGEQILILTFVVEVIGGLGSIRGAFCGALIVGITDTTLRAFLPSFFKTFMSASEADALGAGVSSMGIYLVTALVLLIRPQGCSMLKVDEKCVAEAKADTGRNWSRAPRFHSLRCGVSLLRQRRSAIRR